jgi:hypothetical protein
MLIGFYYNFIYGLFNDVLISSPELFITEVNLYHFYTICIPPPHIPARAKFTGSVRVHSWLFCCLCGTVGWLSMMNWEWCVVALLQVGPLSPHLSWGLMINTTKNPGHDSLSRPKFEPGTSKIQVRSVAALLIWSLLIIFLHYYL